jgi:hypothetical protein
MDAGVQRACLIPVADTAELANVFAAADIPEPTPPITRTVSVGEVVSDRLASNCGSSAACAAVWQARFQLTAPTDGTLVVRVNWDPDYWDTYLKLRIGDRVVSSMEGIPSSDVCTSLRDRRTCSTLASRRLD